MIVKVNLIISIFLLKYKITLEINLLQILITYTLIFNYIKVIQVFMIHTG